ncbi:MAG: PKD domain-containing protein [Verrucomicrobia bacterium]|nr:PKD domain-containing protein [Verrucomicrobiota bacterium]
MNTTQLALACTFALALSFPSASATERFVSPAGGHIPPFNTWTDAATNIQAAIDASVEGDVIWVTNGLYATGGKVMAGDLTNRVALDKALTVRSVNGPAVTIIQGEWDPITTNGPAAVRGAWLTNGAILSGFTLTGGATRDSGDTFTLRSGGGVWSASTGASVQDCFIVGNSARIAGAGAYQGFLDRCVISNNASGNYGGGAASSALLNSYIAYNRAEGGAGVRGSMLTNCAVIRNSADFSGGGASQSLLVNCTLTGNSARSGAGAQWGGGGGLIVNSVLWDNIATLTGLPDNHSGYLGVNVSHTCTTPLLAGTGNISANPQLLPDGVHLTETSPCRGAGNPAHTTGTDIDGQSWENPPAIGCDEWRPQPLMVADPQPRLAVGNGQARITAAAAGLEPLQWQWTKDGMPLEDGVRYTSANTASLLINQFGVEDAGAYQVVASNAYGMATSQVVQVGIACVDGASLTPAPPYSSWESAAANIQDAVDVAGPTDVVLVTNGIYATGGRVMLGDLTNRVVVDKPLLVMSVNGPEVTIIQGQWDPVDKVGPAAARCVWLENGAALSGFTLRDGATSASQGSGVLDTSGGGVRCASTNAVLANCVITNCYASLYGGGAMGGTLSHCKVVGNTSLGSGGGAYGSLVVNSELIANRAGGGGGGLAFGWLHNSAITGNFAGGTGGGVNNARLVNCTLLGNTAGLSGGGAASSAMTNCIAFFNTASAFPNVYVTVLYYSCTTPLASGPGNIADDPEFVDGFHLAPSSPCRGTGNALVATGTDLEGEPWANPPSMGCDEVWESGMVGPLAVGLTAGYSEVAAYGAMPLYGQVEGRASRLEWSFGEGLVFTNLSYVTSHVWTNAGEYQVTFTAYNADNAGGATTNLVVHVVPLVPPPLTAEGLNGTNFSLSFPGQSGVTYLIEQTTNLVPPVTWQTVRTILSTGALMQVMDPRATNAMRFYRVRTP